jgi:cytochrome bd ubiquinol oxidase subunit I
MRVSLFGEGLWKVYLLLVMFIIFFSVVAFVIYPSQGGNISSTQLQQSSLSSVNSTYNETLPVQSVGINYQGRSIFIAFVMLSHVVLANLQLGGSWVGVGTERFYLKNRKPRDDRLARSVILFNVIIFSLGATLAGAGVLFFISLFPVFASNFFHIFWWPLFIEAVLFALEIVLLAAYWYTWGKISPIKHQALGYAYAVDVFIQTLAIDTLASAMLTPGITSLTYVQSSVALLTIPLNEALATWFNPTLWPLQWHRLFAAIGMVGFSISMLAVFHFIKRKGKEDRAYWDWVARYGLNWGLLGLLAQPFLGLWYMLTIQSSNALAFTTIMHGPRAWAMLLMIGVYTFLILSAILFYIERRQRVLAENTNRTVRKVYLICFWIAVFFGIILVQPGWLSGTFETPAQAWILGSMNLKYVSMGVLVSVGALLVGMDLVFLSNLKEEEWGSLNRGARGALVLTGFFSIFIVLIMGFFRESARQPWLYYGIIPVANAIQFPTPLLLVNVFGVWVVAMIMLMIAFWFTSRATAYHPEESLEKQRSNK